MTEYVTDEASLLHDIRELLTELADKPIPSPIENEMERRAICLRLAIEMRTVTFSLKETATPDAMANAAVEAARVFEAYVTGPTKPEAKRELASQLLRSASTDEGYSDEGYSETPQDGTMGA